MLSWRSYDGSGQGAERERIRRDWTSPTALVPIPVCGCSVQAVAVPVRAESNARDIKMWMRAARQDARSPRDPGRRSIELHLALQQCNDRSRSHSGRASTVCRPRSTYRYAWTLSDTVTIHACYRIRQCTSCPLFILKIIVQKNKMRDYRLHFPITDWPGRSAWTKTRSRRKRPM
jgi:hypothetical protein